MSISKFLDFILNFEYRFLIITKLDYDLNFSQRHFFGTTTILILNNNIYIYWLRFTEILNNTVDFYTNSLFVWVFISTFKIIIKIRDSSNE